MLTDKDIDNLLKRLANSKLGTKYTPEIIKTIAANFFEKEPRKRKVWSKLVPELSKREIYRVRFAISDLGYADPLEIECSANKKSTLNYRGYATKKLEIDLPMFGLPKMPVPASLQQ